MLKSFLLISLRNILKNTGTSYFNILGLTLGLSTCLFLFNYIAFEVTYDKFANSEDVYRVETLVSGNSNSNYRDAYSMPGVGQLLREKFTEISYSIRLIPFSEEGAAHFRFIKSDGIDKKIYIEKVYDVESSIFDVLPLNLIEGDKFSSLTKPNSILLSLATAKNIFKKELDSDISLIGKEFKSSGIGTPNAIYVITGIFDDYPVNSHLKFDALIAINTLETPRSNDEESQSINSYTYIKKAKNSHLPDALISGLNYPNSNSENKIYLKPIQEIHLSSKISNNPEPGANKELLIFLGSIGLIVMLLACTNYINNSIFNSINRSKEIGVRKLLGIKPYQLIMTFIGEAFLVNFISGVLSIFLFHFGIKLSILFTEIDYPSIGDVNVSNYVIFLSALLIISTLLSSIYPTIYLNSLKPIDSLKGKHHLAASRLFGQASQTIRSLLIFQLTASIVFLSGVFIVYSQLKYMEEHDKTPFELSVTGIFPGASGANTRFTDMALNNIQVLIRNGTIRGIELSNLYKGELRTIQSVELISPSRNHIDSTKKEIPLYVTGYKYMEESLGVFLTGQNFNPQFGYDSNSIIVNTTASEFLGYDQPDSIIGQVLTTKGGKFNVIGVVQNLKTERQPRVYVTGFRYRTYVDLTLQYPGYVGQNLNQFLDLTQSGMTSALPYFSLLTRDYQNEGHVEANILKMFLFFSLIALLIANMGMFGLSFFITQKRTKEIGIRKVLGATTAGILLVLLFDFLKLVMAGAVISIPLILLGSKTWLENYPFRITVEPIMIIMPIVIILFVCLVVISEKYWRIAVKNPVYSLEMNG